MGFVRKGVATAPDPGTRPGLHGQTLLSSGHGDLDRLLGGGLPLGTLLLVLEDGWSTHHTTLLRYFLGEGAACGQSLLLAAAAAPSGGLAQLLPQQLVGRWAREDKEDEQRQRGEGGEEVKLRIAWQYRRYIKASQQRDGGGRGGRGGGVGAAASRGAAAVGGSGGPAPQESRQPGSRAGGAAGGLKDWCHRFDLTRGLGEEGLQGCRAELTVCSGPGSTGRLAAAAAAFLQSLLPQQQQPPPPAAAQAIGTVDPGSRHAPPVAAVGRDRGPQQVGRLAVLSLGSLDWDLLAESAPHSSPVAASAGAAATEGAAGAARAPGPGAAAPGRAAATAPAAVLQALLRLKAMVRGARCAAVVSVPGSLFEPSDLARMQHIADGVISLESVADDSDLARLVPDPSSLAGLLHLRKLPALGTILPPAPEAALHLLRHRRRRLSIRPVEIDPDAEATAAGAEGEHTAAAAAQSPCTGRVGSGSGGPLDF